MRHHLVKQLCGRLGLRDSSLACEQQVWERWLVEANASTKKRLSNRFGNHGRVIDATNLRTVNISKIYTFRLFLCWFLVILFSLRMCNGIVCLWTRRRSTNFCEVLTFRQRQQNGDLNRNATLRLRTLFLETECRGVVFPESRLLRLLNLAPGHYHIDQLVPVCPPPSSYYVDTRFSATSNKFNVRLEWFKSWAFSDNGNYWVPVVLSYYCERSFQDCQFFLKYQLVGVSPSISWFWLQQFCRGVESYKLFRFFLSQSSCLVIFCTETKVHLATAICHCTTIF